MPTLRDGVNTSACFTRIIDCNLRLANVVAFTVHVPTTSLLSNVHWPSKRAMSIVMVAPFT